MKTNIVYLLTNISKDYGRRFYIGSKQECSVEEFDGIMTILNREDKPYYSSTTSFEMLDDVKRGDILEASILEDNILRENLTKTENYWIKKMNAVYSDEYYNKAYAILDAHYDPTALGNKYGETIAELSVRNSAWSKREGRAKESGFDNFGEMYLWIWEQKQAGVAGQQVSKSLGKERHYAYRTIKHMDLDKAKKELDSTNVEDLRLKLRTMVHNNCSPTYACELLGLELASGRILLGDYKCSDRAFVAALKRGKTKDELELEVTKIILNCPKIGNGFKIAAKELNLSLETTKRYFIRYVKANLKLPE